MKAVSELNAGRCITARITCRTRFWEDFVLNPHIIRGEPLRKTLKTRWPLLQGTETTLHPDSANGRLVLGGKEFEVYWMTEYRNYWVTRFISDRVILQGMVLTAAQADSFIQKLLQRTRAGGLEWFINMTRSTYQELRSFDVANAFDSDIINKWEGEAGLNPEIMTTREILTCSIASEVGVLQVHLHPRWGRGLDEENGTSFENLYRSVSLPWRAPRPPKAYVIDVDIFSPNEVKITIDGNGYRALEHRALPHQLYRAGAMAIVAAARKEELALERRQSELATYADAAPENQPLLQQQMIEAINNLRD